MLPSLPHYGRWYSRCSRSDWIDPSLDPNKKCYNNKRLITLNAWIVLLAPEVVAFLLITITRPLAAVIQAASQSVGMFIGARFLIGFGLIMTFAATYNSLWNLGAIVSWRIPSAMQGLPSLVQICLVWFSPESPRWLISKGREEQALQTLAYYHADGNIDDPLVRYEFNEIKAALEFDRHGFSP
ncbi:hypothetical protein BT96DRAFT_937465 [Gymnopus androsaceus JB14]|uniref:Major facilitator superfamily (MFS) profile domain-containing protein n=1 Tax=Gymnopus androsaceus JB14 TaxID=1447944 RepID=A0A6A4HXV8_9AGAR|nr:hypothetical protein BT96DRAFT_937465 [Gymnopus androsaceus JB14]